jgi:hypothetical protein
LDDATYPLDSFLRYSFRCCLLRSWIYKLGRTGTFLLSMPECLNMLTIVDKLYVSTCATPPFVCLSFGAIRAFILIGIMIPTLFLLLSLVCVVSLLFLATRQARGGCVGYIYRRSLGLKPDPGQCETIDIKWYRGAGTGYGFVS